MMPLDKRGERGLVSLTQPGDEVLVVTSGLRHGSARYGGTDLDVQSRGPRIDRDYTLERPRCSTIALRVQGEVVPLAGGVAPDRVAGGGVASVDQGTLHRAARRVTRTTRNPHELRREIGRSRPQGPLRAPRHRREEDVRQGPRCSRACRVPAISPASLGHDLSTRDRGKGPPAARAAPFVAHESGVIIVPHEDVSRVFDAAARARLPAIEIVTDIRTEQALAEQLQMLPRGARWTHSNAGSRRGCARCVDLPDLQAEIPDPNAAAGCTRVMRAACRKSSTISRRRFRGFCRKRPTFPAGAVKTWVTVVVDGALIVTARGSAWGRLPALAAPGTAYLSLVTPAARSVQEVTFGVTLSAPTRSLG